MAEALVVALAGVPNEADLPRGQVPLTSVVVDHHPVAVDHR